MTARVRTKVIIALTFTSASTRHAQQNDTAAHGCCGGCWCTQDKRVPCCHAETSIRSPLNTSWRLKTLQDGIKTQENKPTPPNQNTERIKISPPDPAGSSLQPELAPSTQPTHLRDPAHFDLNPGKRVPLRLLPPPRRRRLRLRLRLRLGRCRRATATATAAATAAAS